MQPHEKHAECMPDQSKRVLSTSFAGTEMLRDRTGQLEHVQFEATTMAYESFDYLAY